MKEAIVNPDTTVQIQDAPIPEPGSDQVLVKVLVSGTNPKDWKIPAWFNKSSNSGDDVAGYVEAVGSNVAAFRKGDRVAGFHVMMSPHGSFAEYAILPAHTTFHIPEGITLEQAATVPLAAYTAAVALHSALRLPSAWDVKNDDKTPVIVYGASTAIGAFALKLLSKAQIHPVIAVGSKTSSFVTPLLQKDKGDVFLDYTTFDPKEKLGEEIAKTLKATGAKHFRAFDCVSENGTTELLADALDKASSDVGATSKPLITVVLPFEDYSHIKGVEIVKTTVGKVHEEENEGRLFGAIWTTALATGLKEGWFTPHPHEVVNGLEGLDGALKGLREGTVRGKKMVIRVAEDH